MRLDSRLRRLARRPRALVSSSLLLVACGSDALVSVPPDSRSRTIDAAVGQEVDVTLGNVGPAEYQSPPAISSQAVTYIGVEVIPPFNPGGPTQRFRLRAAATGTAIVDFHRILGDSIVAVVEDTIRVR